MQPSQSKFTCINGHQRPLHKLRTCYPVPPTSNVVIPNNNHTANPQHSSLNSNMAKGNTVNWDSQETWQRVVAAVCSIYAIFPYARHTLTSGPLLHRSSPPVSRSISSRLPSTSALRTFSREPCTEPASARHMLNTSNSYDTLENRFRKIKKESAVLKAEVENGERTPISTPSRTPKQNKMKSTPQKDPLGCECSRQNRPECR